MLRFYHHAESYFTHWSEESTKQKSFLPMDWPSEQTFLNKLLYLNHSIAFISQEVKWLNQNLQTKKTTDTL